MSSPSSPHLFLHSSTATTPIPAPARDFIDVLCHAMELFPILGAPGLGTLRATCTDIRTVVDEFLGWKSIVASLSDINTFNIVNHIKVPFILEDYAALPETEKKMYRYGDRADDTTFAYTDPRIHKSFASLNPFLQCSKLYPFCAAAVAHIQTLYPVNSTSEVRGRHNWGDEDFAGEVDVDGIVDQYAEAYEHPDDGGSFRYKLTFRLIDLQLARTDLSLDGGPRWYRCNDEMGGIQGAVDNLLNLSRQGWAKGHFRLGGRCQKRGLIPCSDEHIAYLMKWRRSETKSHFENLRRLCGLILYRKLNVMAKAKSCFNSLLRKLHEEDDAAAASEDDSEEDEDGDENEDEDEDENDD